VKRRNTALQGKNGAKRARFHMQSVRLSHAEWTALRARARAAGDSVSTLIRKLIAANEVRELARDIRDGK
jgi:predicted DNA-binding ribbon-helix-helix protein